MNDTERHDLDAALRSSAHLYTNTPALGRPDKADLLRRSRARKQQRVVAASVGVVAVVAAVGLTTRLGSTSSLETGIANTPATSSPPSTTAAPTTGVSPTTGTPPVSGTSPITVPITPAPTSSTGPSTTRPGEPRTASGNVLATMDLNPRDINAAGDILGLGPYGAVIWSRATGQITAIDGILPSAFNEEGLIAGNADDDCCNTRAARWTPTGGVVPLTEVGKISDARDINDAGHVVGHIEGRAYLWTPETGARELPLPDGASRSVANALNEHDEVVGYLEVGSEQHAFYWSSATGTIDLGTLGGRVSIAKDINDQGTVVGNAQAVNDGPMRLFTWTAAGGIADLGTIGVSIDAVAINNHGTIIGNWFDGSGPNYRRGFIFTPSTGMRDMASREHPDPMAISLNEADQVAVADGDRALLWELDG